MLSVPLEELPDGSVRISMHCPVHDCKHRFLVRWEPPTVKGQASFNGIPLGEGTMKLPIIPPFTKLNSIALQAMRKHFQQEHS